MNQGNTTIVFVAVIQGVFLLLGIFGTWYLRKISRKQDIIHEQINGMKDELVKKSADLGEAKGKAEGKLEERAEVKERKDVQDIEDKNN